MKVRTVSAAAAGLLLAGALTACTTTIEGTPGPRPTLSQTGDFPSGGSGSPTDSPTGSPTDTPTDEPTDTPTDEPTDTPSQDGTVDSLCSNLSDAISGPDIGESGYRALAGLAILSWGLANADSDPFTTVDAQTTKTCPDVRTAVLAKTNTPDLKSLG